ncbi:hypothetical protein B0H14DRAFT_2304075, partial [Mycena olivaceomarginata]
IRGNGNVNVHHNNNKWWRLNQIISHERLGILIVGEAHLDEERLNSINTVYKRQLLVHFSRDPNTPNANGVAIVISKGQLKTDGIITREIIPGRAMILETTQHDGTSLSILGVYAPNASGENAAFWLAILYNFVQIGSHAIKKPDVLGGDMNFVEDALDRLP